jgi:hypothetical protein
VITALELVGLPIVVLVLWGIFDDGAPMDEDMWRVNKRAMFWCTLLTVISIAADALFPRFRGTIVWYLCAIPYMLLAFVVFPSWAWQTYHRWQEQRGWA